MKRATECGMDQIVGKPATLVDMRNAIKDI